MHCGTNTYTHTTSQISIFYNIKTMVSFFARMFCCFRPANNSPSINTVTASSEFEPAEEQPQIYNIKDEATPIWFRPSNVIVSSNRENGETSSARSSSFQDPTSTSSRLYNFTITESLTSRNSESEISSKNSIESNVSSRRDFLNPSNQPLNLPPRFTVKTDDKEEQTRQEDSEKSG